MVQLRNTKQRKILLEILQNTDTHPGADWLYQKVRQEMPQVSLGTIYRNLNILREQGLIRELKGCGTQSRFDGTLTPHGHFFCLGCGEVHDIPNTRPTHLEEDVRANMEGYLLSGVEVSAYGYCPRCKEHAYLEIAKEEEH